MKKKIVASMLTLALAGSLLAGCGSGSSTGSSAPAASGSTATETDAVPETIDPADYYEIVMVIPTLGTDPAGLADVEAAINEEVGPALGVKVTLSPIFAFNLQSEQNLMITSGDKIDLAMVLFTGLSSWVNQGSFLELDDLYAQYGQDIERAEGVAIAGGYYDGKLYAIPSEEKLARSYGFWARTDMLEELNIEIDPDKIYTADELEEIFAAYKDHYGDGYYCVAGNTATSEFFTYFNEVDVLGSGFTSGGLMNGGFDADAAVTNIYATDEYAAYADRMYNWAQKGYIPADAATNTDSGTTQIQTGFYFGSFSGTETDMQSNMTRDCGYPMTAINTAAPWCQTSMYQSSMWAIPSTCENPEKAFQFLNYLYADNTLDNTLTYGLEGVSYEVVEKGEKDGQMVVRYAEGVDASNSPYNMGLHVFGDKTTIAVFEPMTLDYYTMCEEFNNSIPDSRKSKTLGYVFNSTPVSSQQSAVSAVVQQYSGIIAAGAQDPATVLPEFNKALTEAGIDAVIAENQKQLDAWRSAQ